MSKAKTPSKASGVPAVREAPAAFRGVALRLPQPGGAAPALPRPAANGAAAPDDAAGGHAPERRLPAGCWFLRFMPRPAGLAPVTQWYDGTLRVETAGSADTVASGDLYLQRIVAPTPGSPSAGAFDPSAGIPIFSRNDYRHYLRVTRILSGPTTADHFTLGFEMHRFVPATNSWSNEGAFEAEMRWAPPPVGFPSDYLEGELKDAGGSAVGSLSMGWVSKYLRRALVEIDRVADCEWPLDDGAGKGWQDVFDAVGWKIDVVKSASDVVPPSGESWSDAEMHAAMLLHRDSADLDREWRYHVLCVRRIDSTPRGIMYDSGAADSNNVPREGIGISTHWTIPMSPEWGKVKGMRFGAATAPYFRTALHEIGHAMGLYHNTVDNGVMNTTDVISMSAIPPVEFPDNVKWAHASDDQKRLRHFPDIWVRPGGIPFGLSYATAPISPGDEASDADGLALEVEPLMDSFPIGAPVRVRFRLRNTSNVPVLAPGTLHMRSGAVKGKVVDPSGAVRTFSPLVLCVEELSLSTLAPGTSVENALTLLRGGQGPLFPASGYYRVIVEVDYEAGGRKLAVTGEAAVMVAGAMDDDHAGAARQILSSPDALLTLVLGGDHLPEGVAAIQAGLDNPVLRPHYAAVEARRLGRCFGKRHADYVKVAELLDEHSVLTGREVQHIAEIAGEAGAAPRKSIKKKLLGLRRPPPMTAAVLQTVHGIKA